jgi:hypothetical protein
MNANDNDCKNDYLFKMLQVLYKMYEKGYLHFQIYNKIYHHIPS